MNAGPAQMVPASGWTGGRMLGVDRVYQVAAGEALQPLPKESRFGSSMMPFGERGGFVAFVRFTCQ